MFAPGPRRQSRVVFLSPDARIEDVILDDDMAFRVLVMRDSASPSPEGFDVVYESAREGRFSDRLVAVAAELYRFETLVVVQPEPKAVMVLLLKGNAHSSNVSSSVSAFESQ